MKRPILIALAAALFPAALPASASARVCDQIYVPSLGQRVPVRANRHVGCHAANREVAAAYNAFVTRKPDHYNKYYGYSWDVRGWRCIQALGGSQAACTRGKKTVLGGKLGATRQR